MTQNKLFDRYDDAYLDFSDNFNDLMDLRSRWFNHQINLDNPSKAQRAQLKTALDNAAKFYAVANRLYKAVAKRYKKNHDDRDCWELGYIKAEIKEVNYNVWRLSNLYAKDKIGKWLTFPKAPENIAN